MPYGAKDIPDPDENYSFSASVVNIWKNEIADNLIIPFTAFRLAANNTPAWVSNNTWEWKYNVTGVAGTCKARLSGKILSNEIRWAMYITRTGTGAHAEFLWFEGVSSPDGNSGKWTLMHSYQFQEPMLQIDWTKTGKNISSVKYTYLRDRKNDRTNDPFKGSYLQYGITTDPLNASFTVHFYEALILNDFVDVFIEWSTNAGNGRVKALYKFGDNDWHCWDKEKNNVTCPAG